MTMPARSESAPSQEGVWGLPITDLDEGINETRGDLDALHDARILITGGTGFLGSWLVASLLRANTILDLGIRVVLLTRNPKAIPFCDNAVNVLEGDVRSLPEPGAIDVIVHGAAMSSVPYGHGDGEARHMTTTIVDGTMRVLEVASRHHARMLFLSSGAVYGCQTAAVSEDDPHAPDPLDPRSIYAQAKRLAETLCAASTDAGDVQVVIARLFAFVGPRVPLHVHFAIGNFLADVLERRPIEVRGDGRPYRSYLYTGDLPEWCLKILLSGTTGRAYNVGSPDPVSIAELAHRVAMLVEPSLPVRILGEAETGPAPWYVPNTDRATSELALRPRTSLDESLRRTFDWLARHQSFR